MKTPALRYPMKLQTPIDVESSNACSFLQKETSADERAPAPAESPNWSLSERGKNYLLVATGIVFVGLGAIGAFLPGIPTVGPLLVASFCFSKSCPWLERRLIRNRFFARFHSYLDGDEKMTLRTRLATIATMWASIGISLLFLYAASQASVVLVAIIVVAGLIGTWFIARFRRFPA